MLSEQLWKCIDKIKHREQQGIPFFSAEFFPPRTEAGAINLFSKFDRLATGGPLFIDITWGAGGGDPMNVDLCTGSFFVASTAINYCGLPTMLHLTGFGNTKDEIRSILEKARISGIRNILALRGDEPSNTEYVQEFMYASDLVRFIREETGDYFGICVAGYPNGHPDCKSFEDDLEHLKEKIDAGADFVITQLFYETEIFIKFVYRCREIGIKCPIIPGILPIQSYASLRHLMKLSKIKPPDDIIAELERNKNDDGAIRAFGIAHATKMCKEIMESKCTPGLHFYTLNQETAVIQIVKNLDLWSAPVRNKPWLTSANEKRCNESIRPIFWSGRPKSYLMRTKDNEFPNGRWGDSSSPSFGNLTNYYLFRRVPRTNLLQSKLQSLQDISNIFCDFILGNSCYLPWCEDNVVSSETYIIRDDLLKLNRAMIFTINSQPAINGILSDDLTYGWGGCGGYVYQKAYLEFFMSPELLQLLIEALQEYPNITYHALNRAGKSFYNSTTVNAVTWGVFPGKEIIQPTVVDPDTFPIWKEEAFEMWKYLYHGTCPEAISIIYDSYFLVNLVDNDYIHGNIFAVFDTILS